MRDYQQKVAIKGYPHMLLNSLKVSHCTNSILEIKKKEY